MRRAASVEAVRLAQDRRAAADQAAEERHRILDETARQAHEARERLDAIRRARFDAELVLERVADLVGQAATVITPVAADGVGEIAYVQAGTRYSAPARAEGGAAFASGATVKITRVVGTQFYVAAA